ncbi:MAG: arginine--tRNA ligase [bacterium]
MKNQLEKAVLEVLADLGVTDAKIAIEHPEDLNFGDYSTNASLVASKKLGLNPRQTAEKIVEKLNAKNILQVEKIEIAGPGFINFYLQADFFEIEVKNIPKLGKKYGSNDSRKGEKILIEYTDPNPFKQFHIGHLMSNSVGETMSRFIAFAGAEVKRACYSGDVGLHVAKAIWGYQKLDQNYLAEKKDKVPVYDREVAMLSHDNEGAFWGLAYTFGSSEYDKEGAEKAEIDQLNKVIFEGKDEEIMKLHKAGKAVSMKHFEEIFKKLGTKFDRYYFESEVVKDGLTIVTENSKGIFEKSDNATIFRGENYGLHTRVFVNSVGVPTYETKELGLNTLKFKENPNINQSIIITAHEQSDYFKVVLKALSLIEPEVAEKTKHISHGMLRFAGGKMSSRRGDVITGESMISDVEEIATEKIKERVMTEEEKKKLAEIVAVGAIRYSILKQEAGKDIIFDFEKSLSFEGDSGPYLQYTCVRAKSIVEKAKQAGVIGGFWNMFKTAKKAETEISRVEKIIYRFPEVVVRCQTEYSSHFMATYLIELSSEFNSYYANHKIVDKTEVTSPYRVAIAQATAQVLENGLNLMGIEVPEKM